MKIFLGIFVFSMAYTVAQGISKETCPAENRRLCKDCAYYYAQRVGYLTLQSGYRKNNIRFDPETVCSWCFALSRDQQTFCRNCLTDNNVINNNNERWCPVYATAFKGDKSFGQLIRTQPRPWPKH